MAKARLHWFWRGAIAGFAGLATLGVWYWLILAVPACERPWKSMLEWLAWGKPNPWIDANVISATVAAIYLGIPTVGAVLAVQWLLSRWANGSLTDGELHCRHCNHILRGLSEPRCPECGEAI